MPIYLELVYRAKATYPPDASRRPRSTMKLLRCMRLQCEVNTRKIESSALFSTSPSFEARLYQQVKRPALNSAAARPIVLAIHRHYRRGTDRGHRPQVEAKARSRFPCRFKPRPNYLHSRRLTMTASRGSTPASSPSSAKNEQRRTPAPASPSSR